MAARLSRDTVQLELTETEKAVFAETFEQLKKEIVSHGYAQKAADALSLELSVYKEKSGSGDFFYALRLTTPGSWQEMDLPKGTPYTQLTPRQQSMVLAFEIGMNMFSNMGKYLNALNSALFDEDCAGGGSGPVGVFDIKTTFEFVDIETYMKTLTEALHYRLRNLALEQQQAPKPQPPRGPGL